MEFESMIRRNAWALVVGGLLHGCLATSTEAGYRLSVDRQSLPVLTETTVVGLKVRFENGTETPIELANYNLPFDIGLPGLGLAPGLEIATPTLDSNATSGHIFGSARAFQPGARATDVAVQDYGVTENQSVGPGESVELFELNFELGPATPNGLYRVDLLEGLDGEAHPYFRVDAVPNGGGSIQNISSEVIVSDGGIALGLPLLCDFDFNGECDTADVDYYFQLGDLRQGVDLSQVDPQLAGLDLDFSGIINQDDRDLWLALAADAKGLPTPYPLGDADLNGQVGLSDFNILRIYFGQSAPWSGGDFDASATIELSDFNILRSHFGDGVAAVVPEPAQSTALWALLFAGILTGRRRRL
jgi:hypothetical protein